MSSSPAPEFDLLLRDFITSYARTVFADAPLPQDHDDGEEHIFTVYSNFPENPAKEGPLPASKSSIEDLPTVTVTEEEDCAICLTDYGVAVEAKEMPCKHRFHTDCITKWLGIHGSCPVCRYEMPVDEEEQRRRDGGGVWQVVITVTSRVSESGRDGSGSVEGNGSSVEDMDIIEGNGSLVEDMDIDNDTGGNGYSNHNSMEDLD